MGRGQLQAADCHEHLLEGGPTKRQVERIAAWIETLSPTLRPVAYGAFLVVMFMLLRGGVIILPIAAVYDLLTSATPFLDMERAIVVAALAIVGGAVSGLAYGLVGRHVEAAFSGGRYVAGIVTSWPYMLFVTYIVHLLNHEPVWRVPSRVDCGISAAMALVFGPLIGYTLFQPSAKAKRKRPKRST